MIGLDRGQNGVFECGHKMDLPGDRFVELVSSDANALGRGDDVQ